MFMGQDGFIWWIGVVEDNNDPLLIGRARVRIFGYHPKSLDNDSTYSSTSNNQLATDKLPWAIPVLPLNFHNLYGKVKNGEWVFGFFLDGAQAQEPVMIGYLPAAYAQSKKFSKTGTPRSFADLEGAIPDGTYNGADFSSKSNRLEWHSPSNHHIRITEEATDTTDKDFVLAHSTGNMFLKMGTSKAGVNRLTLNHPSGTYLTLTESDIIVNSSKGSYGLIDQLNWISLQTHTTSGGSEFGSRTFVIGKTSPPPPPPAPAPSGGGGGGVCFSENAYVLISNGSQKKISEINVGDYVLSNDRNSINRVTFIEKNSSKYHAKLYSPSEHIEPFATLDHPLYVNDELIACDIKTTNESYPWLNVKKSFENVYFADNKYEYVYNLWLDGDSTYVVNGYGTTSIIYDGGMLADFLKYNYFDVDYIRKLYEEYTTKGNELLHGAFILNYLLGKLKSKMLYKCVSYAARKPYDNWCRKLIVTLPMLLASKIAKLTEKKHKWRFIK